jgi:hypothetical protein
MVFLYLCLQEERGGEFTENVTHERTHEYCFHEAFLAKATRHVESLLNVVEVSRTSSRSQKGDCFERRSMGHRLALFLRLLASQGGLFAEASPAGKAETQQLARRFLGETAANVSCLDFVLRDSYGDGWDGATYSILTTGDEVLANGMLIGGYYEKSVEVCVPEAPACYAIQVTEGSYPLEISWTLGALSGGAPFESDFYVSEGGDVSLGSCSSTPTMSLAPTTTPPSYEPTPTLTRACFDLVLKDMAYEGGWDGALYSITTVDDEIVAEGTLSNDTFRRVKICGPEAPACYTIRVTVGSYPSEVSWTLGYYSLTGGAPFRR